VLRDKLEEYRCLLQQAVEEGGGKKEAVDEVLDGVEGFKPGIRI